MKFFKVNFIFILTSFTSLNSAMGQYSVSTLDLDDHLTLWYDSMIGQENIGLIEGSLYPFLNKSLHSHEYFIEKYWQHGRLTYKGQNFEVNMLYNTFHDLLLIQNVTNSSTKMEPLKLVQYLISDFEIGDKIFKRLDGIEAPEIPGFYQVLFEAPEINILVRRAKKKVIGTTPEGNPGVTYYPLASYFLMTKNHQIKINNKSAFFKAYPSHKQEIRDFIGSNGLLIKPNQDRDIKKLAMYCHQMKWE
jgi:hypothetical protein